MKPNFSEVEFSAATSIQLLPCLCYNCNKIFFVMKKNITQELKHNRGRNKFCSFNCSREFLEKRQNVVCTNCGILFEKEISQIPKSGNNFCSKSCNVTYNNLHKIKGNRRSKLEIFLETELIKLYPVLEMQFNCKDTINSELDIYIPSLKLAFELNGIFHYEPIYGQEKLSQIQNNDNRKFQACIELSIELCIIDASQQIYFKESTSKKYLKIIVDIINNKLNI